MNTVLEAFNQLDAAAAAAAILPANGSQVWAARMATARPFPTTASLLHTADETWRLLDEAAWQQAFDSHPRIGERHAKAATAQSLEWSANEQADANAEDAVKAELAAANREYEARFGRIFIVCATGKTAAEMLAILRARLTNDAATELREAVEQQRQITQIRLRKWLGLAT